MTAQPLRVLFLCTGNSARSIMAEVILDELGAGRFETHSAGSRPTGIVHPAAIARLRDAGHATVRVRSKSWGEYDRADAPRFDYVITVCDGAARESCPVWPGSPVRLHWSVADPAAIGGDEDAVARAFDSAYRELRSRITAFVAAIPVREDRA